MKKLIQKQKIEIRPPKMSDLNSLLAMINSLVEEKAMIIVQDKVTLKQERHYLKEIIKTKNAVSFFLIINGEVMGSAGIIKYENIKSHIGEMGIIIKKEARGLGLGEKLFKKVMEEGIKKFKLRIVILDVFKGNKIAQNLYKKLGFQKIGLIRGGEKYYDQYVDNVMMAKYLK
ncbi:MAG: GNAT family protein [Candidatus Paceibacterota bacterium]|jgi:RimJ/RimL family protein N-acetyltransferase